MTDTDHTTFARALVVLAETLGEPLSELRGEGYWEALRDLPLGAVLAAMHEALRMSRFFPKPADLRGYVTGQIEDTVELAWTCLLEEIRRVGWVGTPVLPAVIRTAVDHIWGGWRECCETMPAGGPELLGWRKMFLAHYQAMQRSQDRERLLMAHEPIALPEHGDS